MVGLLPHTSHRLQPLDVSFFSPLKTYYSQACDNFMVTHPGQTITDKNIGELLSTAYFKAATVGNAVKGFKECGIEPHNPLVFSKHEFAAAKTTDHDAVGDETENNSANSQTLVVENQHINPPEEPELMAKADSDAPKKPVNVFDFKSLPKATQCEKKKSKKLSSSILTSTLIKEMLEQREKQKEEQEGLKKQRKEAREAKKGVKKLKLSSCRPKSIKSRPTSPAASTSKDVLLVKRNIVTLQQKNGSSAVNAKNGGMRISLEAEKPTKVIVEPLETPPKEYPGETEEEKARREEFELKRKLNRHQEAMKVQIAKKLLSQEEGIEEEGEIHTEDDTVSDGSEDALDHTQDDDNESYYASADDTIDEPDEHTTKAPV